MSLGLAGEDCVMLDSCPHSLSLSFRGFNRVLPPELGQSTKMVTKGEQHLCGSATQSRYSKMQTVEVGTGGQ